MSWRDQLEDRYTVVCKHCGYQKIDPSKKPAQKYLKGVCPACKKHS